MHNGQLHFPCGIARNSSTFVGGIVATLVLLLASSPTLAVTSPVTSELNAITPASLLVADTALDIASMQSGNVMQRIAALRSGARGLDLAGLNVQTGERRIAGDSLNAVSRPILGPVLDGVLNGGDSDRWGVFANGDVRRNSASPIIGATSTDSIGMTTGIDYRLGDHLAVGSSVGYASFGIDSPAQRSVLDVQSRRVSLFGTYFRQDFMHVDGLIAYGTNAYDSVRRIGDGDVQGLTPIAKGATSGSQISGALTSVLDLRSGPWTFGPKLGAYFLDVDVDRVNEYGAGEWNLAVGNQHAQSLRLSAGAHLSLALDVPFGVLTPTINADFIRDDDRAAAVDVRLPGDSTDRLVSPDAAFSQMDPGYFVWSVGASAKVAKALSGFVNYRSVASVDQSTRNELTWGVRFETKLR